MALCVVFACGHCFSLWLHLREHADYDLGEHEELYVTMRSHVNKRGNTTQRDTTHR